ncbi:fructosamine kinase family protein [Vibrio anguillarum]|uniref:Fructosamine kinase family protein n=1 Tax=Vibrio anguillarum TaxID=55601 RepID=A0A289GAB8_VIBAN|nr:MULTISPECIES: fructosamine kinase family protein [Vibrio]ASW81047.1 fructosamine kinase family protein [Vibrio anguillarum]AZS23627.1 fructosamine kinase family protein [Vibrio anguillarum]MBF4310597.1 fructosamine kinase family protein [Vibrio anguillarum]MBF4326264.1 fructosamine kinase family protein [Vibrio anguillarum]MBT2920762.1 fructosamine kinase family protein [Vibrio anguillarum]
MWQTLIQQLSDTLMFEFNPVEKEKVSGGDISDCYMISDGEQRYFVKVNTRDFLAKFEIEGENLRSLRETSTVQVPELVMIGTSKNHAFIVLNYLPTKPLDNATNSYEFGVQLAKLHQWGEQKEYGFDAENYIGSTLQPNPWDKKWGRFFAEQRIGWQLQLLREKGIELFNISELVDVVQSRLANHSPRPSLLHGDLWHGNVANSVFGPICYDPACYWGDRECDIAMTELFEGFQPEFYQGYESILPLSLDYVERKNIYNLYHVLNHYNQFGGHYLVEAESLIKKILSF